MFVFLLFSFSSLVVFSFSPTIPTHPIRHRRKHNVLSKQENFSSQSEIFKSTFYTVIPRY